MLMGSKIAYSVIFCLSQMGLFAQNVVLEYDCVESNSTIFAEVLIEKKGEQYVSKLLEEGHRFLFFVKVDSCGYVRKVMKVRSKGAKNKTIKDLSSFLTGSEICIYKCYQWEHGYSRKEETIKRIKENLQPDSNGLYFNHIAFPHTLMVMYEIKKDKQLKEEKGYLSKLDYLKSEIKRYKDIRNAWEY